jgi:hypothetical protein
MNYTEFLQNKQQAGIDYSTTHDLERATICTIGTTVELG